MQLFSWNRVSCFEGKKKILYIFFVMWRKYGIHNNIFLISISVKPEIHPVPDNGIIVAKTGDSVTLGCMVTRGSPDPEVTWRRQERKMPNGEDSMKGLSLTYTKVTRHHSGVYICSADNGFGEPTTAILKLDVQRELLTEIIPFFVCLFFEQKKPLVCTINTVCSTWKHTMVFNRQ